MKNVKKCLAVFLTAVLIAGFLPAASSAADTRESETEISVETTSDTAVDAEQKEDISASGKARETDDAESAEEAGKSEETDKSSEAAKEAAIEKAGETEEVSEDASEAGKTGATQGTEETAAEGESAETGKTAAGESAETDKTAAGKSAETDKTAEDGKSEETGKEACKIEEKKGSSEAGEASDTEEVRENPGAVHEAGVPEGTVSTPEVNATEATYTVTLNAGSGGYYIDYSNNNAHVQTVTHTGEPEGRDISAYAIPKANPGKIFAGWSTSAGGTVLPTGTTVTKDLYLYAVWEQGCAVTLDANGGHFTLEDGTQADSVMTTVAKGDSIFSYSFVGSGTPEADGKRLAGYGRMADGKITLLPSEGGTGYTVTEEALTLYAVWINVCEITYDAAGGGYFTGLNDETVQSATFTETLDEGSVIYNMSFINLVAYEGCTFLGWSLKADGSEMIPSSGYTVEAGSLTLYAVWDGLSTECTVTYDANGGNFPRVGRVRPTVKMMEVTRGSTISLLDSSNYGGTDPSMNNCEFVGWSFAADSNELISAEEYSNYTVTKDITVYAVWSTTLTFDANGGSFQSGETVTDTILLGTTVDLGKYEIPAKTGFIFGGWAESDLSTNTVADDYLIDADNVAPFLYAVWVRDIRDAVITLLKTQMPYNGAAQTPAVTVVYKSGDRDENLTEGTDYTVTYSNNINAGTASVKIEGIAGRYIGSVTKTFTITRIAQTLSLEAVSSYVTVKKTVKVTAGGAKETSKYTFTSSNTSLASVSASGATGTVTGVKGGKVVITVTTPQTVNYLKGTKTVTITVVPAAPDKPKKCRFVKWQGSNYKKCVIAWNKVSGASGYQTILSWTDGSHAVVKNLKPNVLQQTCDVAVNHVSQLRVRAYVDTVLGRKYSLWSNVEYITPSPTNLKVKKETTSSGVRKARISWNIIYGCNGYNVFLTTNPNGKWYWNQSTNVKATSTSAVITKYRGSKLKKGQTYYVRIVTRRKRNGVFCTVPMPAANTYIGTFRF